MDIVDGSSAIRAAEYDAAGKTVTVHFHSGHRRPYGPLSEGEYREFLAAPSVGRHFHTHIKPKEMYGQAES